MSKHVSLLEAGEEILKADRIIVTGHTTPDGDCVGSALALANFLKICGKSASVVFDDKTPASFSFLAGYNDIIDISAQDAIIPDSAVDCLVVVDTDLTRIGRVRQMVPNAVAVNIDHHRTNSEEADYLFCDHRASSVAELIFTIVTELGGDEGLTADVANCLYVGIATDTGFFKFSNTRPSTLRAAASLVEAGAVPHIVSETLEARTADRQKCLAEAVQTLKIVADGRVAGLFLPYELMQRTESTEGFIDFVRVIDTVEVALLVKAVEPNVCRASLRSKGLNVADVAEKFGGGGHWRAAGCTINEPLEKAKELLIAATVELVENSQKQK